MIRCGITITGAEIKALASTLFFPDTTAASIDADADATTDATYDCSIETTIAEFVASPPLLDDDEEGGWFAVDN